jgi:hypothetical protein
VPEAAAVDVAVPQAVAAPVAAPDAVAVPEAEAVSALEAEAVEDSVAEAVKVPCQEAVVQSECAEEGDAEAAALEGVAHPRRAAEEVEHSRPRRNPLNGVTDQVEEQPLGAEVLDHRCREA